ncbi:urea transporter, partial [Streptomyces carpinensis]|uniref:urea transporter n=1 Tax=Streptomyces carpinensis TaxID=66369 RepID=UPI001ABEF680
FLAANTATLVYALLGAATATVAAPALAALLAPAGGRALTWPFVLTTLTFLAAAKSFPRLTGHSRPAPERGAAAPSGGTPPVEGTRSPDWAAPPAA